MTSAWLLRLNGLFLLLILGALLTLVAMFATDARGGPLDPPSAPTSTDGVRLPGTPISAVPYIISAPGRYYLTRDLTYNGTGNAIAIAEFLDYVTLDLNGFTLAGFNAGTGIKALGPTPPSQFPLNIQNGYVRGFQTGIDVQLAAHVRIEDVHVYANTNSGISIGNHGVIDGCTSANNGTSGIGMGGALAVVRNCMIVDNGDDGVLMLGFGNILEDSQILRGDVGVRVSSSFNVIRGNTFIEQAGFSAVFAGGGAHAFLDNLYCFSSGTTASVNFTGSLNSFC